jgi:hypothetical protein
VRENRTIFSRITAVKYGMVTGAYTNNRIMVSYGYGGDPYIQPLTPTRVSLSVSRLSLLLPPPMDEDLHLEPRFSGETTNDDHGSQSVPVWVLPYRPNIISCMTDIWAPFSWGRSTLSLRVGPSILIRQLPTISPVRIGI